MSDETTPQDDAAMPPASTGSIADIIDRLLAAVKADAPIHPALVVSAAAEIERLRFAIRRLAEQDATLSVCEGAVTVTMDATLTDAEREALQGAAATCRSIGRPVKAWPENHWADTIDAFLDRHTKGGGA